MTAQTAAAVPPPPARSRLWLWFVAAFLLQLGAWTAWFVIAAQHKVQEVPLERTAPVVPNPPTQEIRTS